MLGSMASLNFPDLGSLPSLGVFGKDGLPQMNSLMFSDNPRKSSISSSGPVRLGRLYAGKRKWHDWTLQNHSEENGQRV